jgi:hypothetical protein
MTDDTDTTEPYWAWHTPATGRTPAFDQDAARAAAAADDPNPKGSMFFAGPDGQPSWAEARRKKATP